MTRQGDMRLAESMMRRSFEARLAPRTETMARAADRASSSALAKFLDENPGVGTNQDFINYFYRRGGFAGIEQACTAFAISSQALYACRSGNARDLVTPPRASGGALPTSASAAARSHVVQYRSAYNSDPNAPAASSNCGPASLAMALDLTGRIPPGMSAEQRIDYARALMFPSQAPTSFVTINGRSYPQLDADRVLTSSADVQRGAQTAGTSAARGTGWAGLDAALTAGQPLVAFGNITASWRSSFPSTGYQLSRDVGHFIAIVGRTQEGKYVVSDPMFSGGPVELTREQLQKFFPGDPAFVAVSP